MELARPKPGWKPSTPEVRGASIDGLAQRHPVIAIHFWADWNGSDVTMDRSIQVILKSFDGKVHFVSCNIDLEENGELCRRCQFKNISALSLLVAGVPRRPIIGAGDPEWLASKIELMLREPRPRRWWQLWGA